MPKDHGCANCGLRAQYDKNPNSLLGRLWRWHAGWCPGFKSHLATLPETERAEMLKRYQMDEKSP